MSLVDMQRAIAQIYTQTDIRQAFFSDPNAVGHQLNLDDTDIARLTCLSKKQVEQFAASLKRKRLNEIRKLLPTLHRCLGKRFSAYFWRYAETYHPKGIRKHHHDAYQFCQFLIGLPAEDRADCPWLLDLAACEAVLLQSSRPWLRWRFLQYDISMLADSASPSEIDVAIPRRPTLAIWLRRPGTVVVHRRSLAFSWPVSASN
ncbi:MAG: hypothetical protein AAFX40_07965 [Cyanobacteria bacterium J06639_1]